MREVKFVSRRNGMARSIRKYASAHDVKPSNRIMYRMQVAPASSNVIPVVSSVCPDAEAVNLRADGSVDERGMIRNFNGIPLSFQLDVNGIVTNINSSDALSLRNDVLAAIAAHGFANVSEPLPNGDGTYYFSVSSSSAVFDISYNIGMGWVTPDVEIWGILELNISEISDVTSIDVTVDGGGGPYLQPIPSDGNFAFDFMGVAPLTFVLDIGTGGCGVVAVGFEIDGMGIVSKL